jgi:hypothetical protein
MDMSITEKIKNSLSFARISMYNNINLIMFYCTSFMKDNIYYIPEFDVIVIVEFDNKINYIDGNVGNDTFTIHIVSFYETKRIGNVPFLPITVIIPLLKIKTVCISCQ